MARLKDRWIGAAIVSVIAVFVVGARSCEEWIKRGAREADFERRIARLEAKRASDAQDRPIAEGESSAVQVERSTFSPSAMQPTESLPEAIRVEANVTAEAGLAELARLRAEVEQLRKERDDARAGDLRRRRVADHFAVNELHHAELWRELIDAVFDGDQVTADPLRPLAPLLRLAEGAGIRGARSEEGRRLLDLDPPPVEARIESSARIDRWMEPHAVDRAGDRREVEQESLELEVFLLLPKMPAGWHGGSLRLEVHLTFTRRSDGGRSFVLDVEGPADLGGTDSDYSLELTHDGGARHRAPWNGGDDHTELAPGQSPIPLATLDEWFEKLRALAR